MSSLPTNEQVLSITKRPKLSSSSSSSSTSATYSQNGNGSGPIPTSVIHQPVQSTTPKMNGSYYGQSECGSPMEVQQQQQHQQQQQQQQQHQHHQQQQIGDRSNGTGPLHMSVAAAAVAAAAQAGYSTFPFAPVLPPLQPPSFEAAANSVLNLSRRPQSPYELSSGSGDDTSSSCMPISLAFVAAAAAAANGGGPGAMMVGHHQHHPQHLQHHLNGNAIMGLVNGHGTGNGLINNNNMNAVNNNIGNGHGTGNCLPLKLRHKTHLGDKDVAATALLSLQAIKQEPGSSRASPPWDAEGSSDERDSGISLGAEWGVRSSVQAAVAAAAAAAAGCPTASAVAAPRAAAMQSPASTAAAAAVGCGEPADGAVHHATAPTTATETASEAGDQDTRLKSEVARLASEVANLKNILQSTRNSASPAAAQSTTVAVN